MPVEMLNPDLEQERQEKINPYSERIKNNILKFVKQESGSYSFRIAPSCELQEQIRDVISEMPMSKEKKEGYELCIGEIISNILKYDCGLTEHSQKIQYSKPIEFVLQKNGFNLAVKIKSPGNGFNFKQYEKEAQRYYEENQAEIEKFENADDLSQFKMSNEEIDKLLANNEEVAGNYGLEHNRGMMLSQYYLKNNPLSYEQNGKVAVINIELDKIN